jgi:HEAT repeat protein
MKRLLVVCLFSALPLVARGQEKDNPDKEPLYKGKAAHLWIQDLKDKDADTRQRAAQALGHIRRSRAVVPALIDAVHDPDYQVREEVVVALGRLGPRAQSAVPVLIDGLKDKDGGVRERSADSLGKIGCENDTVIPALIDALKEKDVRLHAARALGGFGAKAKVAVPALIAMAKEGAPASKSDSDSPAEKPTGKPKPSHALVRVAAITALGGIGPDAKEAVPLLAQATKDKDAKVRDAAQESLRKIESPSNTTKAPAADKKDADSDPPR